MLRRRECESCGVLSKGNDPRQNPRPRLCVFSMPVSSSIRWKKLLHLTLAPTSPSIASSSNWRCAPLSQIGQQRSSSSHRATSAYHALALGSLCLVFLSTDSPKRRECRVARANGVTEGAPLLRADLQEAPPPSLRSTSTRSRYQPSEGAQSERAGTRHSRSRHRLASSLHLRHGKTGRRPSFSQDTQPARRPAGRSSARKRLVLPRAVL